MVRLECIKTHNKTCITQLSVYFETVKATFRCWTTWDFIHRV